MTPEEEAKLILEHVGGRDNVSSNIACMTRLRLSIKDDQKVDLDSLNKVPGVLTALNHNGQLQVVLGPGKVDKVAAPFAELTGLKLENEDETVVAQDQKLAGTQTNTENVADLAAKNKTENKQKHNHALQRGLQHIANVFIPLLPGIIAAGLINGITNVVDFSTGMQFNNEWWYMTIKTLGWALFTFLPIFVGMNAAREFRGSAILGGMGGVLCLGASVVGNPLATQSISMPITNQPYTVGVGGLIAALMMGIFFAELEKSIRKFMPDVVSTFFTPLLTVIIGGLLAVVFLQPIGAWLTNAIYVAMDFVYSKLSWFGGFILSSIFLPLVSVGLHQALTPIHVLLNDPTGPTKGINYLLPILMMAGGGQVGAGLALFLKTKNQRLKKLVAESIPVGILGVGEPLIYAVTLPLGRPFITSCIGAGFGGVLISLFHVGAISQGVSGLFGLLIMQPGNQLTYLFGLAVAYLGGFICTWLFGVNEARINQVFGENQ